jgi:hypothetical protein
VKCRLPQHNKRLSLLNITETTALKSAGCCHISALYDEDIMNCDSKIGGGGEGEKVYHFESLAGDRKNFT